MEYLAHQLYRKEKAAGIVNDDFRLVGLIACMRNNKFLISGWKIKQFKFSFFIGKGADRCVIYINTGIGKRFQRIAVHDSPLNCTLLSQQASCDMAKECCHDHSSLTR